MRYLVVVEQGPTSFGAYVPDLPGCVAAGETRDEALALIREAIASTSRGFARQGSPFRDRRRQAKSSMLRPPRHYRELE